MNNLLLMSLFNTTTASKPSNLMTNSTNGNEVGNTSEGVFQFQVGDNVNTENKSVDKNSSLEDLRETFNSIVQDLENMDVNTEINNDNLNLIKEFISEIDTIDKDSFSNEDIAFLQAVVALLSQEPTTEDVQKFDFARDIIRPQIDNTSIAGNLDNNSFYNSIIGEGKILHDNQHIIDDVSKNILDGYSAANLEVNDLQQADTNKSIKNDYMLELLEVLDDEFITEFRNIKMPSTKRDIFMEKIKSVFEDVIDHDKTGDISFSVDLIDMPKPYQDVNKIREYFREESLKELSSTEIVNVLSEKTLVLSNNVTSIDNTKIMQNQSLEFNPKTFPEDLSSTLIYMKNNNINQLKIKLTPRELGDMVIDISKNNTDSVVKIIASNKDTLDIIKSNLSDITKHLREINLISDNSTVSVDSSSEFSSFDGFSESNTNKRQENSKKHSLKSNDEISESFNENKKSSSILDVLA